MKSEINFFMKKNCKFFFNPITPLVWIQTEWVFVCQGEKITPKIIDLPSESLAYGTVQVPKQGLPILLMKDCQTIGGYSKLGYLPAVDIFKIAQLRPKLLLHNQKKIQNQFPVKAVPLKLKRQTI